MKILPPKRFESQRGDLMKEYPNFIRHWLLPKHDKEIDSEIDMLNIKTIHYVSLAECVVQTVCLIVFLLSRFKSMDDPANVNSVVNVSLSIVLCIAGFIVSGVFMRKKDLAERHTAVSVFVGTYMILLVVWGMLASVQTFIRGEQIITFFTVELITVMLLRLRPLFTSILVMSSYTIFYIGLNVWIKPGMINPYNYFMMGVISVAGAVIIYRITVSYIEQKNKANRLNDSLEIIANHDSATRLQNRYALNQRIPEYLNTDICIAMLDINKFKAVNDTYGHKAGDDVLKAFSDLLLDSFDHEEIYRYGGDEFLIVSLSGELAAFRQKLTELNDRFGEVHISGVESCLSCCFGCVSARPENPADFFDLVMWADKKLYEEKSKV